MFIPRGFTWKLRVIMTPYATYSLTYYEAIAVFTKTLIMNEAMHRFTRTAHAICGTAVGWFPVTEDKVEDDWRDRGRDQHLARGERGLV